ncbi:putative cyclin-D6-1 isoform X2 [Pyrus x bretschneideri]|uniref:putative cyclin-D6-1 isoform X2 n=1 Tax=Pyrus x bretschneideri TaxID=225117 RepID=UPI002030F140|nr:putative cyclin-D6-1 isoform X2 [Pyrus x bretschneideri]
MDFDLENPLTISHDFHPETLTSLFSTESDHMTSETYFQSLKARDFDISIRREAISSISKLCCNSDELLLYLAVNYLDRFLSCQGMLKPKPWLIKLLAISCISLASKMKKSEFSLHDVQGDGGIIFDTQTIQRMEVLILGALKWRMRSITPFSFMSFFISLFKLEDPPLLQALKARATQIIFKSQKDVEFLVFKPSIIAAAALLSASHELFPMQFSCFKNALSHCSYVNKENMLQCYSAMQGIVVDGFDSILERVCSSVVTPANVLDHTFSSSAESGKTRVTSITTLRMERDLKRRKISVL